jgi:NAD(P)H-hydrate epimerase
MQLFNAKQMRGWDQYTIQHEPIAALDLMERAAAACTEWLMLHQFNKRPVYIFCGNGNNGGDGLAIARQLAGRGLIPHVYVLHKSGSAEYNANLERFAAQHPVREIGGKADFPVLPGDAVVIDTLFGTGLSRPLEGIAAALVDHINKSHATVVSIDVPSGMFIDMSSVHHPIVRADHTLSFQRPKLCFMVRENSAWFGSVTILDIGLHPGYPGNAGSNLHVTVLDEARQIYKRRDAFSHKGDLGHALIVGGAAGKAGAAILAAESCLRTGAGLTSLYVLSNDYQAINTRCPEVMTVQGDELVKKNLVRYSAIGIGPGLGTDDIAHHIVSMVIDHRTAPSVFDADALNILSIQRDWLSQVPPGSILTPHPKEFDRLFGEHRDDFARIGTALSQSAALQCVIVLKGHHTLVAADGEGHFNTTGNPGLAKGGSGDVLTGIITGLLGQGYEPRSAAVLGVYIHGLASDIAVQDQSYESLIASDLNMCLGKAFKMLSNVS